MSTTIFILLATTSLVIAQIDRHIVPCGTQQRACECREKADECEFTLKVEALQTFVSYEEEAANPGFVPLDNIELQSLRVREEEGKPFYINNTGYIVPSFVSTDDDGDSDCVTFNEDFDGAKCSVPLTVDGRTYRSCIAINGQVPGPTLIVYENQTVVVNVVNELLMASISIHWHGMNQRNTPWMDGALLINQCPISPMESFRYYFKADPAGSFWYHSHRDTQRADGLFGGLIVRETAKRRALLEETLGIPTIVDDPGTQTLNLHEWYRESLADHYTKVQAGVALFPDKPLGEIPVPPSEQVGVAYEPSEETLGPDGLNAGDIPFFSGLINGKGRNRDVPYERTRLEVFSVEDDNVYRFRLLGTQSEYPYRFSIDEHNLTVIATDGYFIEPVEAQFVIIHIGERYDFLLKANKPREDVNDYWMRAETLEANIDGGLPYPSLGNVAEAILHYNPATPPRSTSYEAIKNASKPFDVATCGSMGGCVAVNCPFPAYHQSYNIRRCVNSHEFRLLWETPSDELPSASTDPNCEDCELFFNIGSNTGNINGINMRLPSAPLQTQRESILPTEFCDVGNPCPGDQEECPCLHVRAISSFNKTIRFVLSSVGSEVPEGGGSSHPIHLHGHHFFVLDIGYGSYFDSNGTLRSRREDIVCNDRRCTSPSWRGTPPTFNITSKTVRKDTIIVPAGGYVVIQFISDNPGYWFMHCHIISDLLEGMAVVINVAESRHNPAPPFYPTCGGYSISQKQFYESLAFDPDSSSRGLWVSWTMLSLSLLTFIL